MNDKTTEQGQPRRVPTRPGWWWIEADPEITRDEKPMQVVQVTQGRGGLLVSGTMPNRVDQRPDIVWLAPIPGPSVLAALAEYGEAVAAYDADELRDANRELTDAEWSASEAIERAVSDATAVLDAAIRAERDGGA